MRRIGLLMGAAIVMAAAPVPPVGPDALTLFSDRFFRGDTLV